MTVRKGSELSTASAEEVWATSASAAALAAVAVATTPSTAAAASCTLPTTPREPALQARIASVSAPATRYRPMASAR